MALRPMALEVSVLVLVKRFMQDNDPIEDVTAFHESSLKRMNHMVSNIVQP